MSSVGFAVIYPRPNEKKEVRFGFSYDWALIGTALHTEGHNVLLKDYSVEPFVEESFVSVFENIRVQIAIIEFDSFSLKRSENDIHGRELIKTIRRYAPKIKIIAYGHYPCITKCDIKGSDITIMENSFNAIFSAINLLLPNQFISARFDSFDDYCIIDRNFINENIPYFDVHKKSSLVQTSVGCNNSCIFCQRKGWQQDYCVHSDEYVLHEFELLKKQGVVNLWITDENFTFSLSRAKRLLSSLITSGLTAKMKIAISSWANIDEEFLDIAKAANIMIISFGIETGNAEILEFYRKNIDLEKAKRVILYADQIGIYTVGNFILGAPMDTMNTISQTFNFIESCHFDQINLKTLVYMQGAELFTSLKGALKNKTAVSACKENGLNDFSWQELTLLKEKFLKYYRDRRKPALQKKNREIWTTL